MGHTNQANTLLDPSGLASFPPPRASRIHNKQNKQSNQQHTPSHQPRLNHRRSADEHPHPLYLLHLPIKQQWVLCGLKALAESTPAAELSSTSTALAGLLSGSLLRASTASSEPSIAHPS